MAMSSLHTPKIQLFMFRLLILLFFLACVYIYIRGWQALPAMRSVRIIYTVIFAFLTFGHVLTFLFRRSMPEWFTGLASTVGPSWMIVVLYLFMAILLIHDFAHFYDDFLDGDGPIDINAIWIPADTYFPNQPAALESEKFGVHVENMFRSENGIPLRDSYFEGYGPKVWKQVGTKQESVFFPGFYY